jgi:hypothetical protein
MTLECLPCLRHACLAPWPGKTTGGRRTHWWRNVWVPRTRQIQVCSAALHCSRRLCLCGPKISPFQWPVQPTRRGRVLPRLLVLHVATCKWHKSALEHQHPNVKSRATQQADEVPLQKTFTNVRRDVADQRAKYLTASECNGLFTGAQAQASATLPECWLQDEALPESYRSAKDGQDSFRALPQAHPSTCGARGAAVGAAWHQRGHRARRGLPTISSRCAPSYGSSLKAANDMSMQVSYMQLQVVC